MRPFAGIYDHPSIKGKWSEGDIAVAIRALVDSKARITAAAVYDLLIDSRLVAKQPPLAPVRPAEQPNPEPQDYVARCAAMAQRKPWWGASDKRRIERLERSFRRNNG